MGYSILSGDSRSISLRYIDNLDAKMYMCEENYEKLELRKITEKKPFGLDKVDKVGGQASAGSGRGVSMHCVTKRNTKHR